ncbi:hypothetical protein CTAM01_02684 [Colletotrichum tamarilloi]|uniref:Uncharacterized protein n=1 Tax=Colletotrichum tamarilloi TaxID=1209934 RepID=A0ABQ9RMC8_9PEZI|nr:uncharacterized protein CTAM01_02684 [Colletotrichum tamarilloi]KAK1507572.1 hypothetical protein CTAM01_02684 [Colletotrichum tamarilloi]
MHIEPGEQKAVYIHDSNDDQVAMKGKSSFVITIKAFVADLAIVAFAASAAFCLAVSTPDSSVAAGLLTDVNFAARGCGCTNLGPLKLPILFSGQSSRITPMLNRNIVMTPIVLSSCTRTKLMTFVERVVEAFLAELRNITLIFALLELRDYPSR